MSLQPSRDVFLDRLSDDEPRTIPGSPACRHALARLMAGVEDRTVDPARPNAPAIEESVPAVARGTDVPAPVSRPRSPIWRWVTRLILAALIAVVVGVTTTAALILAYGQIDPPASALMLIRRAEGQTVDYRWMPLKKISPHLVRAVIASEDARFCSHSGIDVRELERVVKEFSDGEAPRGGSTMSMQLAKNLFLWPDRSYIRKALEAPLTLGLEAGLSKRRIAEIYLNVVEWGPGIFGAEAAARYHFGKAASRLTREEAALLAVTLPRPLVRNPGSPDALTRKLAANIVKRAGEMGHAPVDCIL